jgi:hypothetical protein
MPLIVLHGSEESPDGAGVVSSDGEAVGRDIIAITSENGSLDMEIGDAPPPPPLGEAFHKVTYTPFRITGPRQLTVGQALIFALVNVPDHNIIIYGADIATVKSLGVVDGLGDTRFDPSGADPTIRVYYDTTECAGLGTFVVDAQGKPITNPTHVTLFHELAHAKHLVDKTFASDLDTEERLTRIEENQYRQSFSMLLRSVSDGSGGCRTTTQKPFGSDDTAKGVFRCFIVTAASGSQRSLQVKRLQQFRDTYLRRTAFGIAFFNELFAEYYQFSPAISVEMVNSQPLCSVISTIIVEPFLDFLSILESYLTLGLYSEHFIERVKQVLAHGIRRLTEEMLDDEQVRQIYLTISNLNLAPSTWEGNRLLDPPLPPPIPTALNTLEYLVQAVRAHTPATEYTGWALVEPLRIQWFAIKQLQRTNINWKDVSQYYAGAIGAWISNMPIPEIFASLSDRTVCEDLAALRESFFKDEEARRCFAKHLLQKYGAQVAYDLKSILNQAGYDSDASSKQRASDNH